MITIVNNNSFFKAYLASVSNMNKRFIEINDRVGIEWASFGVYTRLSPEELQLFTQENAYSYSSTIGDISAKLILKLSQKAASRRPFGYWLVFDYVPALIGVGRSYNNKVIIAVIILTLSPSRKLVKPWNEALEMAVQHCPPEKKVLLRDVLQEKRTESKIIIDTQTGAHYLFYGTSSGCTMTPLLNSKGEPIVLSEDEITMELMTNVHYIG